MATYHYPDHLSNRFEADASGIVTRTFGHLPFGEVWYETGTPDKWKFTSYERDTTESALDYAINRFYAYGFGRFQSPDPLSGSIMDPQTLNKYSYVVNQPEDTIDPSGECGIIIGGFGQSPKSEGGKALLSLAEDTQSNIVFPFADGNIFSNFISLEAAGWNLSTGSVRATMGALNSSNDGSPVIAVTFSGGAQFLDTSVNKTGVQPTGIDFISPGQAIFGGGPLVSGSDFTNVYRGSGPLENLVNSTSPAQPGQTEFSIDCGHSITCALQQIEADITADLNKTQPCQNPQVCTSKGCKALGGAGHGPLRNLPGIDLPPDTGGLELFCPDLDCGLFPRSDPPALIPRN